MRKKCPVCGKFTFELFEEETDSKDNILLRRYGSCNDCGFYYDKRNLNNKTLDEQVIEYKRELIIEKLRK